MFVKIFRVGEGKEHTERHRANYITHSANPATMKLLHKDHKGLGSCKMRRINGPGMNVGISNLLADILEPIADEMGHKAEKGSTESVLSVADMGPETWEVGKLTPVNLRGYKSKFETNYQLRANFLRLSLWKNKKFVRKYFF